MDKLSKLNFSLKNIIVIFIVALVLVILILPLSIENKRLKEDNLMLSLSYYPDKYGFYNLTNNTCYHLYYEDGTYWYNQILIPEDLIGKFKHLADANRMLQNSTFYLGYENCTGTQ